MATYSNYPGKTNSAQNLSSQGWPIVKLLILGFFVLIVLISVKMLMDLRHLSELGANLKQLSAKEIPQIHTASEIRALISEQESILLEVFLDEDIGQGKQKTEQISQHIVALLQKYKDFRAPLLRQEEQLITEVYKLHRVLVDMADSAFKLIENARLKDAEKVFLGPWENVHHVAFETLDKLLDFEIDRIANVSLQTEQLIDSAQVVSIAVALVGILLSVLLIIFLITSFSKPIEDILLAMEHVMRGDSMVRLHTYRKKPSTPLMRRFNEVLALLQGSFEDCCHELRTSLTVIRGEAEVALRMPDKMTEQDYRESLTSIAEVAQQMGTLVDDLVFLGRSQIGQIEYDKAPIDMSALLTTVVRQCHGLAVLKNIELISDIEYEGMIRGDCQHLRRLFIILLDNAIKYTDPGGRVKLSLSVDKTQIKVAISDSGIGIREQDLPYIFKRFYRAASGRPRSTGGSGLGLAMAKSIVQAHHGEINIDSQVNVGTTMSVVFQRLTKSDNIVSLQNDADDDENKGDTENQERLSNAYTHY